MMLVETTSIPDAALPLAEFKAHLRQGTGFAEDSLQDAVLTGFLRAALAAIEGRTGKALVARDFSWRVTRWRAAARVTLPVGPVSAVTAFDLEDADGAITAVDASGWRLVPDLHAPAVEGLSWLPTIPNHGAAVIGFTAGFGAAWGDIPADLQQAVMLLAAHYYEFRDDTSLSDGCMPFGVTALIQRYRALRLGAGGAA